MTPAFFSSALSTWHPATTVTEVRIGQVIPGTATKLAVELEYGTDTTLPSRMWVKAGWEKHSAAVTAQYRAEVTFYSCIADSLDINTPQCYFAGIDPVSGSGLLLLEDLTLRPVTFGDATRPITVDQVAQVLGLQANYHARHWNSEILWAPWLKGSHNESTFHETMVSEEHWSRHLAMPRGELLPPPLRDRHRVAAALAHIFEITSTPPEPCLIHADPHLGNLFFETDGRPGLLDWQSPQRGHWAHDVTYTLISTLSVEDRRAHQGDLLHGYLRDRAALGVAVPHFDQAWHAYRQHVIYGFMWSMCPPEIQAEENVVAMTERFATAGIDLDTLSVV